MRAYSLLLTLLLAQPVPAADSATIRGTVKDHQGRPLEGVLIAAQVRLRERSTSHFGTTDAQGAFELGGLPSFADSSNDAASYVDFLALKHGWSADHKRFSARQQRPQRLDFVLAPAKTETITVLAPSGEPMAGVQIDELRLVRDVRAASILSSLTLRKFPFQTDARGKVEIDILSPGDSILLAVRTDEWGRQWAEFAESQTDRTFRLQPVGSITGRVVDAAGNPVAKQRVSIRIGSTADAYVIPQAATTDPEGKFEIEKVPAGQVTLYLEQAAALLRQIAPVSVQVAAGQAAQVELRFPRLVRVTGTVVDHQTGAGVAGATVQLSSSPARDIVHSEATDGQGRYTAQISAGQITARILRAPAPYYTGIREFQTAKADDRSDSVELAPLRVRRGRQIGGNVVDENGQPVAGARVSALWREQQDRAFFIASQTAQSDAHGRFVLDAVAAGVPSYLRAQTADRAGTEFVAVAPTSKEPVRLTISPAGVAVLAGRVVDAQGPPIVGATVRISTGLALPPGTWFSGPQPRWTLTTDADGRFETPQPLPRHLPQPADIAAFGGAAYYVTASAPGRLEKQVQVQIGPDGSSFVMPDIVLLREGRVTGRVVDRGARPVAGATVQTSGLDPPQRAAAVGFPPDQSLVVRARTGADGRFELSSVHPEALFVFASHPDFRFTGEAVPSDGEVTIVLSKPSEAALDPPLLPCKRSPEEIRTTLRTLLVPLWDKLDASDHAYQRAEILARVAPHDAEWVLAKLPELSAARYQIRVFQAIGRIEDAVDAAAALKTPDERSDAFVELARHAADLSRRRALLGEAAVEARAIIEPERRLGLQMRIARALYELGDREGAEKIVTKSLPDIETLAAGYRRGHAAETVALLDVDRALALCEGIDVGQRARHLGVIAHRLAAADPARAEAVFRMIGERHQYAYVPRIAYRLARVDLPRARQIADWGDKFPNLRPSSDRPYAYAVMALALAEKDPPLARNLLREAFDLLERQRITGIADSPQFATAVAMLHFAETVDPVATREYFWRTIALWSSTRRAGADEWSEHQNRRAGALLAVVLSRYGQYPDVAARLVEPLYRPRMRLNDGLYEIAVIAMALVDPAKAAAWLDEYFAEMKPEERGYVPRPWELMADAVAGDDAFWRAMHRHVLHLWPPDEEDF